MKLDEIKSKLRALVPDFAAKVQPLYVVLGWEWQPRTKRFIPSIKNIEATLYHLISGIGKGTTATSTGGLRVFIDRPTEYDTGKYGLEFAVQSVIQWNE